VTTDSLVPEDARAEAVIYSKERGVLAGLDVAERVFRTLDPGVRMEKLLSDGCLLEPRKPIARVAGSARALLTGERVALNFLQRLSGIATATRRLAELIDGTGARLVDTRKTAPGLRLLEKYAVRVGGGYNHRTGLFDGILIKDNHIKVAGGIAEAVRRVRSSAPHTLRVEVEVEDLEQLEEAVRAGADAVLLDNMPVAMIREAVRRYKGRILLEASGGITSQNIREIAEAGVDLISVGAITHSAPALDISMDIGEIKRSAGERCCRDEQG
ncbi:MAG: carboxylating nicotinate-nucleotide diphosphorylase, partial [Thermacetogeniaceae bacterium]